MSVVYSYGLEYLKAGTIDGTTGAATGLASVGDIFQDTCDITQGDPTITKLYSAQNPNTPRKSFAQPGSKTLKFSLMSNDADTLAKYLGGTVTTVNSVKQWNAPSTYVDVELAFELKTSDGTIIKIARGGVTAKLNYAVRTNSLFLVDVVVEVLSPKVGVLPEMIVIEPAA